MTTYLEQLNAAKPTVTITPTPLIMERVGESFRGLYVGMQTFQKTNAQTGEVKTMPVAHFYDGEGIRFNMGAQLTRAVSMLKPGISVEIKLIELKPNNMGGKTKIYSVTPLDIKRIDIEEMFGGVLSIEEPAPEHLLPAPTVVESDDDELTRAGIPRKAPPAQTFRMARLVFDVMTPNEWHERADEFCLKNKNWQKPDGKPDLNHVLASAGQAGYEVINADNINEMFDDIVTMHEAKAQR